MESFFNAFYFPWIDGFFLETSTRTESLLETIEQIKQNASNLQTFLTMKEIDKELYKTEKDVDVLCEDDSLNSYGISYF